MKEHIEAKKIAKCEACGGYVKPDIVFFGEGVSTIFFYHLVPIPHPSDPFLFLPLFYYSFHLRS